MTQARRPRTPAPAPPAAPSLDPQAEGVVVLAVHVGRPAPLDTFGETVTSAIAKRPAPGPVRVGPLGAEGDEQADRRHHGGPDKALCVYPSEHYARWGAALGRELPPAAFGENLATRGILESETRLGETWRVGSAVVRVRQPRIPCRKLAARLGRDGVQADILESGLTGFYLQVLEPGSVRACDRVEILERDPRAPTVLELNRVAFRDRDDAEAIERALDWDDHVPFWRDMLRAALARARTGARA